MMKKILLPLGFLLYFAIFYVSGVAQAAITLRSTSTPASLSGAATFITSTINVATNTLILTVCRHGTTFVSPSNVTDTLGNTFTLFSNASNSNDGNSSAYYAISSGTNANDSVRCNFASSVSFRVMETLGYDGVASTSPLDASSSLGTATSQLKFSSALFTTTNANDLLFTFGAHGGGGTLTAPTGYTTRISTTSVSVYGADQIVSLTTSTASATWTANASSSWIINVGAFKAEPTNVPVAGPANTSTRFTVKGAFNVKNAFTVK